MNVAGYFSIVIDKMDRIHLCFINGGSVYYTFSEQVTSIIYDKNLPYQSPTDFALNQNYPNPFNSITELNYQIAKPTGVNISIYNVQGQLVRSLVDEHKPAGNYAVYWDGLNEFGNPATGGIYFYRMNAGGFNTVKKMVLAKIRYWRNILLKLSNNNSIVP